MIIAKTFACIEFDNGRGGTDEYMLEDMTLRCDDARYQATRTFAVVMWIAFPIGIPLASYTLLWSRRREIEERETRLGGDELNVLAFYFRTYAPTKWWMFVVDLLRRLTPCWLLLFQSRSPVLLTALFFTRLFVVC